MQRTYWLCVTGLIAVPVVAMLAIVAGSLAAIH